MPPELEPTEEVRVERHGPDDGRYHRPDARHEMLLGLGPKGLTGVVVPKARMDGTSPAFVATKASVVVVDPLHTDGKAVVDLSRISPAAYENALNTSEYAHEVFYKLARGDTQGPPPPQAAVPRPEQNPYAMPGAYITPASNYLGIQEGSVMQPLPQLVNTPPVQQFQPVPQPMPAAQPLPQPVQPQAQPPVQQWAPPPQPAVDLNPVWQALAQMGQAQQAILQRLNTLQSPPPQPVAAPAQVATLPAEDAQPIPRGVKRRPARADEEEELPQTVEAVQAMDEEQVRPGVIVGFESLEMPFVRGPVGERAKVEVFFALPSAGTIHARYHEVYDCQNCLMLVYDTRYEEGTQFMPPDMGDKVFKVVVQRGRRKQVRGKQQELRQETYWCSSIGLHGQIGVLDVTVLIKSQDQEPIEENWKQGPDLTVQGLRGVGDDD